MINFNQLVKNIIFLSLSLFTVTSCQFIQPVFNVRWNTSAGLVDISMISVDATTGKRATATIKDDFAYMDKNWRVEALGDLSRVNMLLATGKTVFISPSLLPLLALGRYFAERSDNLFNPAMGKLFGLWGFQSSPTEHRPIPSHAEILAIINSNPKMENLELRGVSLRSNNPYLKLDFCRMLRGYAVDLAIARLRELGIRSGRVKVGSVIRVIGNRDGQPWHIPVNRPLGEGVLGVVDLFENESLAVIGSHERSFLYDSRRYHEMLDPRTGYPARDVKGVIVLHNNAVTADAASHALFIAGIRDWKRVAVGMRVRHVLLITADDHIYMTPTMAKRLALTNESQTFDIIPLPEFDIE